jgi:hypothetical protein
MYLTVQTVTLKDNASDMERTQTSAVILEGLGH